VDTLSLHDALPIYKETAQFRNHQQMYRGYDQEQDPFDYQHAGRDQELVHRVPRLA
jgi:hypothetical protein